VDDQTQTYTVEALQKLKATHEAWVASTLNPSGHPLEEVRIRRLKENITAYFLRLTSGRDILIYFASGGHMGVRPFILAGARFYSWKLELRLRVLGVAHAATG
jgi:hypothetical protein